jgi:hypothetical protein
MKTEQQQATEAALTAQQDECNKNLMPFKEAFEVVKTAYQQKKVEIFAPLEAAIEKYYDETLLDAEGNTVSVGREFILGKKAKHQRRYRVTARSMQVLLGQMMFNPAAHCQALNDDGSIDENMIIRRFYASDLKELKFIE